VSAALPDGTTGEELRYTGERKFCQPKDEHVSQTVLERDGKVCTCFATNVTTYCSAGFAGRVIPVDHTLYATREEAEAAKALWGESW
jgi:hypothetical protein